MYKLSTGDEVTRSTLATVIQVIAKKRQDRQIWDANDGVMVQQNDMQIKRLQAMKESTPGINNNIGITITLDETFVNNNKEERGNLAEEISQLLTRRCTSIEKLKYYRRYRRCSENGIEVSINRIFHKYGIKIEACHGGLLNGVCVRRLMADSENIIHDFFWLVERLQ